MTVKQLIQLLLSCPLDNKVVIAVNGNWDKTVEPKGATNKTEGVTLVAAYDKE